MSTAPLPGPGELLQPARHGWTNILTVQGQKEALPKQADVHGVTKARQL